MKKKLLVFADSRGQHKRGEYQIYGEKLAEKYDTDLYLCPYKWTTTLDFLELIKDDKINLDDYWAVILHTGIVEHSPRPFNNAFNDLYHPSQKNLDNYNLNTPDYSKKVVNYKKTIFDEIFGSDNMANHFNHPFETKYLDEPTINMYSLEMMNSLIPHLKKIKNLIWISANHIIPGWNGTYFRERPANIDITEEYSQRLCQELDMVVNLHHWGDAEVKKYTLDNMHLTESGSDYIYKKIEEILAQI